jgi:hypothetical protein
VSVLQVGGIFVHKRCRCRLGGKPVLAREAVMPSTPLSPEQREDIRALAQAIREVTDTEIEQLARTLLDTVDTHPFGQTEFTLRNLAHQIAAKAIEQHLARKKTATKAPA